MRGVSNSEGCEMNSININNATTWQELEKGIKADSALKINLEGSPRSTMSRFCSLFTGYSPVADKVTELGKQKLRDHIHDKFGVSFNQGEDFSIDSVFDQLMVESKNSYKDLRTVGAVQKLFKTIKSNIIEVAGTLFPVHKDGLALRADKSAEAEAENVIKIMMGAPFNKSVISSKLIKAVFISKDRIQMDGFKNELESVSKSIYSHLTTEVVTPEQEKLAEMILGNILALYPFSEPAGDSTLQVPQKIAGKWEMVTYTVDNLPMTPTWLGEPVPAFGLKPLNNQAASPLLLFRGTPQPTGSGSMLATASDLIPGFSVGEILYNFSETKVIQPWIERVNKEFGKIKLYGQSLGGSLSLLTLSRHPDKIGEVHAYGSPGILGKSLKSYENNSKDIADLDKPKVNLYWNLGDPVPLTYRFHKDWNLYKVFIPVKQNGGVAHASLNFARPKVVMMKINIEIENSKRSRKIFTLFYQTISLFLLPVTGGLFVFSALKVIVVNTYTETCRIARYYFGKKSKATPI